VETPAPKLTVGAGAVWGVRSWNLPTSLEGGPGTLFRGRAAIKPAAINRAAVHGLWPRPLALSPPRFGLSPTSQVGSIPVGERLSSSHPSTAARRGQRFSSWGIMSPCRPCRMASTRALLVRHSERCSCGRRLGVGKCGRHLGTVVSPGLLHTWSHRSEQQSGPTATPNRKLA